MVDQGRPLFYEKGSHGQEGGQFLLGHRLDRHEPHVRTSHRLADGFGVPPVVLLGLDVRFHVFGVHQLDRVSHLFELPGPVVHPSARFHPDGAGGELRDRLQKPGPGDCLLEDRPAPVVHPVESKNGFCDVDAQRSNLHGGPFSLDVNGKQASPLWLTEAVIPIEAGTISLILFPPEKIRLGILSAPHPCQTRLQRNRQRRPERQSGAVCRGLEKKPVGSVSSHKGSQPCQVPTCRSGREDSFREYRPVLVFRQRRSGPPSRKRRPHVFERIKKALSVSD